MQHHLIHRLRRIARIALTPIIAHRIRENRAVPIERRCADRAPNLRVAFETVLGIFVPEVEGAVAAGGAEGAVHGVEGDGVDGEDVGDVAGVGDVLPMAFEGEVGAKGERI